MSIATLSKNLAAVALFLLPILSHGSGVEGVKSGFYKPTPYWCGTVELAESIGPITKDDQIMKRSIDKRDGCEWRGKLVERAPGINGTKPVEPQAIESLAVYGTPCTELKAGQRLTGLLGGEYISGWSKSDLGTLKYTQVVVAGCPCPKVQVGRKAKIPSNCSLDEAPAPKKKK